MAGSFSKVLLRPGVYHAPQGELRASPRRLRRWAEQFRAMKAAGLKVPVSLGHYPDAVPAGADEAASRQFYLSARNLGYLEDMDVSADGSLKARLDAPSCELDGDKLVRWFEEKGADGVWRRHRTAVGDVSIAVRDWTDGQGRKWPDSIVHVALTPMPVAHGHGGFGQALSLDPSIGYTLSLAGWEGGMEEEKEGADMGTPPPEAAPPPATAPGADAGFFPTAIMLLAKHKIPLPPGTTPDNFMERLMTALHALQNAEGGAKGDEPDGDEEGETYPSDAPTQEEQRPVMMSLSSDGLSARDRKFLEREEKRHKEALEGRITALDGKWPAHRLQAFRERLSGYQLSLSEGTLEPVAKRLDYELSCAEDAAQIAAEMTIPKGATEAARPDRRDERRNEPTDEEIAERARRVSVRK